MTIGYGFWSAAGEQMIPSGFSQSLGPLTVPFGSVVDTSTVIFATLSQQIFDVPAGAIGVWIMPTSSGEGFVELSADLESYAPISPTAPTFLSFDPNNYPASFGIFAENATITVQFV